MGLLRTAARASVAAHAVGNVQRRQGRRWAAQDAAAAQAASAAPVAPAAPAPQQVDAPTDVDARLEQLARLGQLRDAGILSAAEFEAQKQRILAGS